jgi:drug/metabolite transporter (DMT)-like permease
MVLGLLGAVFAAFAYGLATILQALGVSDIAAVGGDASVRTRVGAARRYAAGLALDGVGFLASLAALRTLPLFLVESAVASSVAVTAVLAVPLLHIRLRRSEIVALAVTLFGLLLLAVSAKSGSARHVSPAAGWLLFGSCAVVALLLVAGARDRDDRRAAIILAVTSGLGFGLLGVAARTLDVRTPWWHTGADPLLWTIAVQGGLASLAYGLALHRGRATTVAAITFATETVIPAVIGLAALRDAVRPHLGPVALVGFLATLAGSIALAGHAEVPDRPAPV